MTADCGGDAHAREACLVPAYADGEARRAEALAHDTTPFTLALFAEMMREEDLAILGTGHIRT